MASINSWNQQSPWVVHRQVWLYGDDPEIWRPERWLVDEDQKKNMYSSLLTVCSTELLKREDMLTTAFSLAQDIDRVWVKICHIFRSSN